MIFTQEHKRKIGLANKGKVRTEIDKQKNRLAHLGKKHTEETKVKMSLASKGKKKQPFSEEHRKKLSIAKIGSKISEKTKKKMGLAHKGFKHSEEAKRKISETHKGDKNGSWQGGISAPNPYPKEFNSELKLKIRTRDNFTCCRCYKTEREELEELNRVLSVNHIDFDKNNCKESNLNTLCVRCNVDINRDREYWTNYFNNLYE